MIFHQQNFSLYSKTIPHFQYRKSETLYISHHHIIYGSSGGCHLGQTGNYLKKPQNHHNFLYVCIFYYLLKNMNRLNLRGSFLSGMILQDVKWRGMDLSQSYLDYTVLQNADLGGITMKNVCAKGVNLRGANLRGSTITDTDFTHAILDDVDFEGTFMENVILTNASIMSSNLLNTRIINPRLCNVDLTNTDISTVIWC